MGRGHTILDDKLWSLFDVVEFTSVEIPAIASGVDEHPSKICGALDPGLDRVSYVEGDQRRIRRDLAERETLAMTRRLGAVGGDAGDERGPGRLALPGDEHPMNVDGVALIERAYVKFRGVNRRTEWDLPRAIAVVDRNSLFARFVALLRDRK